MFKLKIINEIEEKNKQLIEQQKIVKEKQSEVIEQSKQIEELKNKIEEQNVIKEKIQSQYQIQTTQLIQEHLEQQKNNHVQNGKCRYALVILLFWNLVHRSLFVHIAWNSSNILSFDIVIGRCIVAAAVASAGGR